MMDTYTSLITSNFGISSQLLWWIMISATSVFVGLVAIVYFSSILMSMIVMPIPFVFGIVFGYIPVWFGIMLPMPVIYTLFTACGEVEPENMKPYWEQYGDNLKNAYTSKFGGENPAFNQEVDNHVKIMINNGRGFTRALANDWMKRMGKFTECK